tara:strand:- start:2469 stop:2834 length:366 start_codon:yes stop_codon:yes gene_type:complete
MSEKLDKYLSGDNAVLVVTPEEANLHLGDLDVIAYKGESKNKFREVVGNYRALPLADARRYKEYSFGSDVVVFSSLKDIVDRVDNPSVYSPAPEPTPEPTPEVDSEVDSDDNTPPKTTTWI